MDVFLMIRRNKTSIFIDAKETTTVLEVKKMIEGKQLTTNELEFQLKPTINKCDSRYIKEGTRGSVSVQNGQGQAHGNGGLQAAE